jgi:NTE family protein
VTSKDLGPRLAREPYHLALSAGWFGYVAHAALLFALDEAEVPPTSLSGASSGAVAAALYGAGVRGEELRELVTTVERDEILRFSLGLGVLSAVPLEEKLRRVTKGQQLEDLDPPVAISTCRLFSFGRRLVVRRRGDLARSVHASLAVPGVFRPVSIEGRRYVDGGWGDPAGLGDRSPNDGLTLINDIRRESTPMASHPDLLVLRSPDRLRFGPKSLSSASAAFEEALAAHRQQLSPRASDPRRQIHESSRPHRR